MTKIDIISGFLGAGKTTLIKKLIEEALSNEKIMIIENEFGEIGIDGGFLNNSGIEITEMNSGCICCSLVGDFGVALKEALNKYSPERIIIEPSGVGKLSDVIKAVEDIHEEITLNSLTAVVDAVKCKMYMNNFGEFFNNQIENSNTIILSRSQKISEEKLNEVVCAIRDHNSKATIITTNWDEVPGIKILEAMEKGDLLQQELLNEQKEHHLHIEHNHDNCNCSGHKHHHDCEQHHNDQNCNDEKNGEEEVFGHSYEHYHKDECCGHSDDNKCACGHYHSHGQHHHADEVFTSWGVETPKKYSKEEMDKILKNLSESNQFGTILRAKGIVESKDGGWINFDLVPGEYEVRDGAADYTGRLCVIGTNLNKAKIEELFHI